MNALKATNYGASVTGWASGIVLYWPYADGLDCSVAEAQFFALSLADQIAQSKTLAGLTAMGYSVGSVRDCSTVVVNPPTGGTAEIAPQQIVAGGAGFLVPTVQWLSGKARIANSATPSVPAGSTLYYWISGQQPITALPTDYALNPGDDIGIMAAIVPNSSSPNSGQNWSAKGWTNITIGPAPN